MQEASETLDAFQSMYFLPSADDPATRSLLISSQEAVALAKKGCPSDTNNKNNNSSIRRTNSTVASEDCSSNTVGRFPVPGCSAPMNDRSVLPAGFSTTPAVPNATATATLGAEAQSTGDAQGAAAAAAAISTAVIPSQASTTKASGSGSAVSAKSASQHNAPVDIQTLTQQDTVAVHAWLRERLALAQYGVHASTQQVLDSLPNSRICISVCYYLKCSQKVLLSLCSTCASGRTDTMWSVSELEQVFYIMTHEVAITVPVVP